MKAPVKKNGKEAPVSAVRASARQIWLAGLGALSLAEDESGKLFKVLVKRGKAYEEVSADRLARVKDTIDVRPQAAAAFGKVASEVTARFDGGLTQVLHQLGMPTRKEIQTLDKRVERLTKAIETRPTRRAHKPAATKAVAAEASVS